MSFLKAVWEKWKVLARRFGDFQARVILWLFYYLILPFGALIIKAGRDPLRLRAERPGDYWVERSQPPVTLEEARKQS